MAKWLGAAGERWAAPLPQAGAVTLEAKPGEEVALSATVEGAVDAAALQQEMRGGWPKFLDLPEFSKDQAGRLTAGIDISAGQLAGPILKRSKNAEYWFEMLHADATEEERRADGDRLKALGVEAVPALRRELAARDAGRRSLAASQMGLLGTNASGAAPDLVHALGDGEASVRRAAADALGKIGPGVRQAALPKLFDLCNDPDAGVRDACNRGIESLGKLTKEDQPLLENILNDQKRDPTVRCKALDFLSRMALEPGVAMRLYRHALHEDSDPAVRQKAAQLLGAAVPKGDAFSALVDGLRDENLQVVAAVVTALESLGVPDAPDPKPLTAILQDASRTSDCARRGRAAPRAGRTRRSGGCVPGLGGRVAGPRQRGVRGGREGPAGRRQTRPD